MHGHSYSISVFLFSLLILAGVLITHTSLETPSPAHSVKRAKDPQPAPLPRLEQRLEAMAQTLARPYPGR